MKLGRPLKYNSDDERKEAQRRRQQEFRKRNPGYRNRYTESYKRYVNNNKEKIYARNSVYQAVKNGKIIKPSECENCGASERLEADHADYQKRLDVTWLCKVCHQAMTDERKLAMI